MKTKRVLSWLLALTMVLSVCSSAVFADNADAENLTEFTNAVTAEPIVQEGTATEGYTVWDPNPNYNNTSTAATAKYGTINGENVFVVNRYSNSMKNPLITAKVKIGGMEYKTVIDRSDYTGGGFFEQGASTEKVKFETGVVFKDVTNFFYSSSSVSIIDIETSLISKLNIEKARSYYSYYNPAEEQYVNYTEGTEIPSSYTADRVILHGTNQSVKSLKFYIDNDKNIGEKKIPAWHTVKIDTNGGTINADTEISMSGNNKMYYYIPTKDGYIFDGWSTTNDDLNTVLTLHAVWKTATCVHDYVEKITKEPTCTEKGEKTLTCSKCGDVQTEEIAKLGHNYVDGKCTRCGDEKAMQAMIGSTKYETLTEAINAAQSGDTIVLLSDIENNTAYTINGKDITLDLNGKSIITDVKNYYGVTLSVVNSTVTIDGSKEGSAITQNHGGRSSCVLVENGSVNINGDTYTGYGLFGAAAVGNAGVLNVSDAVLNGYGGNVSVVTNGGGTTPGKAAYKNVTVNASNGSDGIWLEAGAAATIESGTFNGTVMTSYANDTLTINGGTFNGTVGRSGNNGTIIITGGTFVNDVSEFVADGYEHNDNKDNTYMVKARLFDEIVVLRGKTPWLFAAVDSLNYNNAGFVLTTGETKETVSAEIVCTSVSAGGETVNASDIKGGVYLFGIKLDEKYQSAFTAMPFVDDQQGKETYFAAKTSAE